MKKSTKTLILRVLLVLMFWAIYQIIGAEKEPASLIRFSEFLELAEEGRLEWAEVRVDDGGVARLKARRDDGAMVATSGIFSAEAFERFEKSGVAYKFSGGKSERGFWQSVLITWLPMIFLVAVFFFFLRQVQGGGKQLNIAEMKSVKAASTLTEGRSTTFADIVGAEEAKASLRAIGASLSNRSKRGVERAIPGLLITGAPGTGKSLLIEALAAELKLPVLAVKGAEVIEIFAGLGASRIRDLFERAKSSAPVIVAIDAIDAIALHRSMAEGTSRTEVEQTLHQLLASMSELEAKKRPIAVVATTSRPDLLDRSLFQSGRFGRIVEVPLPNESERAALLTKLSANLPLDPASDPALLAGATEGLSPGQIRAAIDQAVVDAGPGERIGAAQLKRAIDGARGST